MRPGRRALRGLTWLGAAALVLASGVLAGRVIVLRRAREVLAQGSCDAGSLGWRGASVVAHDVTCPGARAGVVVAHLFTRRIELSSVEVNLARWLPAIASHAAGGGGDASRAPGGLFAWLPHARVEDLDVNMGDQSLAVDLSGPLWPPALRGPETLFELRGTTYHLEQRRDLQGEHLSGRFELTLDWAVDSGAINGTLRGDRLGIEHPLLASRPLAGLTLDGAFSGTDGGLERPDLTGTLSLGGPVASWHTSLGDEGLPVLELELPDAPAPDWLAPLAPLVPELATATVQGDLGASLRWSLGGQPDARLRLGRLSADGALPAGLDLRYGPFTLQVPDSDGEPVPRRFGEGTPGWVPLADISPDLVHAVLAAEDAGFFSHAGYDPAGIQEALDADLTAGEVQRGGSTLSQQLAKNLFLSGEQTIARKLRELLLAVELDRTLGKDRVLELYLNVVELGPGIHGVGQACEHYLMKRPARVNPLEGAFLAALLPSPRRHHQRWYLEGRPNRAKIDAILTNMADAGWIGIHAAERWRQAPLVLVPPPK
ncbi:MAG: biosynthetic peptidoglycan transglycosylase [Pseudomonadota bacterium]